MANSSHNHRRKLIRQCRREAGGDRKKGNALFREKVAAIVKARKKTRLMEAYGAGEVAVRESLEELVPA